MTSIDQLYSVIREPLLTEKGTDDRGRRNAYHFRVPADANKVEIRQAVEKLFKVKVLRVNTLRVQQKVRRRGYAAGLTPAWKKAMVTLKEGDTIEVI
jgi:large subunit ribosomal protein L23